MQQRFGHLIEVVHHLNIVLGRIDIPLLQTAQGGHERIFAVARVLIELLGLLGHLAQHLAILLEDGQKSAVVDARGRNQGGADLLAERMEDLLRGLGLTALRGNLPRGLLFEIAAVEHHSTENGGDHNGNRAAIDQHQPHDQGNQETTQGRYKPTHHHGHHARNAVYGRLASPGLIGQRRTHGHHKADVGGREGQFERRSHRDEHGCRGEVHRGTDHIVRRAAVLDILILETGGQLLADALRNHRFEGIVDVQRSANQRTREGRRVVTRSPLALLSRRERELGLAHVHRLFRGPKRYDHHHAGEEEDGKVGRDILAQGPHHQLGGARPRSNLVGIEAGHGDTDEVHQVVTGKG